MTTPEITPTIFHDGALPAEAFEIVYGDEFLLHAATLLTGSQQFEAPPGLQEALTRVAAAYSEGAYQRKNAKSEKEQNAALEKISKIAADLHSAMINICEFGSCERRLHEAIMNGVHRPGSSPDMLQKLVPTYKYQGFQLLRDIMTDISFSAQEAMTKEPPLPSGLTRMPLDCDDNSRPEFEGTQAVRERIAYQNRRERERRERAAKYRIPKDNALRLMLTELGTRWPTLSDRPFTEGMHHAEQGTTVSLAVDLAEMMLDRLDPTVPRSQITTTLRKVRKIINLDTDHR
jgi:hypothetical protein